MMISSSNIRSTRLATELLSEHGAVSLTPPAFDWRIASLLTEESSTKLYPPGSFLKAWRMSQSFLDFLWNQDLNSATTSAWVA